MARPLHERPATEVISLLQRGQRGDGKMDPRQAIISLYGAEALAFANACWNFARTESARRLRKLAVAGGTTNETMEYVRDEFRPGMEQFLQERGVVPSPDGPWRADG